MLIVQRKRCGRIASQSGHGLTMTSSPIFIGPRCFNISLYCGWLFSYLSVPTPMTPGPTARSFMLMVPSSAILAVPMYSSSIGELDKPLVPLRWRSAETRMFTALLSDRLRL